MQCAAVSAPAANKGQSRNVIGMALAHLKGQGCAEVGAPCCIDAWLVCLRTLCRFMFTSNLSHIECAATKPGRQGWLADNSLEVSS